MDRKKIIRIITSVLISVALWVYVINVVNPSSTTTVRNIPVNLIGTEVLRDNNLAIEGSGEYTVDITVRATRSDLATLSADNFVATADVSGLTLGQDYISVSVKAPSGYVVEEIRSRKIQVYVGRLETKTVPVIVNCSQLTGNYEATVIDLYPSSVEITGASQLVDTVSGYYIDLDSSSLEYEKTSTLELTGQLKDESGNHINGVNSSTSAVTVNASVYSSKTVKLNVQYYGEPWEGASIVSKNVPTAISIKGPTEIISGISELWSEEISIEGIIEDCSKPVVPYLPYGVYVSDKDQKLSLDINLADTGRISFMYYADDIKTDNLNESLYAVYSIPKESCIMVNITGSPATLKTMSQTDVLLCVDGSKFTTSTKEAKLTVITQIDGVSFTITPATVTVTVKAR